MKGRFYFSTEASRCVVDGFTYPDAVQLQELDNLFRSQKSSAFIEVTFPITFLASLVRCLCCMSVSIENDYVITSHSLHYTICGYSRPPKAAFGMRTSLKRSLRYTARPKGLLCILPTGSSIVRNPLMYIPMVSAPPSWHHRVLHSSSHVFSSPLTLVCNLAEARHISLRFLSLFSLIFLSFSMLFAMPQPLSEILPVYLCVPLFMLVK